MPRTKKPKTDYDWTREKRNYGGSIRERNGKVYARIQYIGEDNKNRDREFLANNRKHAREIIKQKRDELRNSGEVTLDSHRMTFAALVRKYEEYKLFPAEIRDGKKVEGMRSYRSMKSHLVPLREHFASKHLRSIRHSDIAAYKNARLKTPVIIGKNKKRKRQRSIACVNRELGLLRAMMNYAERNEWIFKNPFQKGASLISKVSEKQRERVLTFDEERRLLDACGDRTVTYRRRAHKRGTKTIKRRDITAKDSGEHRAYLRALIITALDTGMRRGELFKLTWSDVDFESNLIRVRAATTKTEKARVVGITPRVREELLALRNRDDASKSDTALVFGITDTIKYAWASLLRQAQIDDLHFHDLRHTYVTRSIRAGQPAAEVMKISGHSQHMTFARYLNVGTEAALKGAELLSEYHAMHEVRPDGLTTAAVN